MLYAIVDIETTGSKPDYDRITEIAICLHDGQKVIDTFSTLVNPERYIPDFITKLTGITNEMVKDAPKFYEIAKNIVKFTEDAIFVAHNVHFDYSFLKGEFKNLGYNYNRKNVCTVRLSRQLIPNLPSYSLGKLCNSIGIKVKNRHRALGDAQATSELFTRLIEADKERFESQFISNSIIADEVKFHTLPPKISHSLVNGLPEDVGVYYFFDESGSMIYIGKSRCIKKRVASHFQVVNKARKNAELKDIIFDIKYQLVGSELIALLLESDEIKKHKPRFNKAQRRSVFNYGIFMRTDGNGYIHFFADKIKGEKVPIFFADSVVNAKKMLLYYAEKYELCQKLIDNYRHAGACFDYQIKKCKGACIQKETAETYNERANAVLAKLTTFQKPNFMIVGVGRNPKEKSLVMVENGKYLGFGYLPKSEVDTKKPDKMREFINFYQDNKDVQKLIREHIRSSPEEVFYFT